MSFYDAVPLEAQQPFSDSPEFDELVESISNDLFSINTDLVTLSKFINSLSLKSQQRKDHNLHDKTLSLSENTTSKFKSLGELKCRLKQWDEPTPGQQFTIEKLSREMNEAFTDFQALQTKLADAEKQNVLEARTALEENEQREQVVLLQRDDDTTEGNQLLMQEEPMNPQEFDYQQTLITEREEEIQNIEQGILELNEIFTDLGAIVVQQGLVLGKFLFFYELYLLN